MALATHASRVRVSATSRACRFMLGVGLAFALTMPLIAADPPVIAQAGVVVSGSVIETYYNTNGSTVDLRVVASDSAGEGNLIYAWTNLNSRNRVIFTTNGSNTAKATTAVFTRVGSYPFQVKVTNRSGLSSSANITIRVEAKLMSIGITPRVAVVSMGTSQDFLATGYDQFAKIMGIRETWWATGGGTITQDDGIYGHFTATSYEPSVIRVQDGEVSAFFQVNQGTSLETFTVTTPVIGDATVSSAPDAELNSGLEQTLAVGKFGEKRSRSVLAFDANGLNGRVVSAVLRLNATQAGGMSTLQVREQSTAWGEDSVTWNSAPAPGQLIATSPVYTIAPIDIDVSAYVASEIAAQRHVIAFSLDLLQAGADTVFAFDSRQSPDAARAPTLRLTFTPGPISTVVDWSALATETYAGPTPASDYDAVLAQLDEPGVKDLRPQVGGLITWTKDGTPVGEVAVAIGAESVVTNAGGSFALPVDSGRSVTITPSKPGWTFTPVSRTATVGSEDADGADFTASIIPDDVGFADPSLVGPLTPVPDLGGPSLSEAPADYLGIVNAWGSLALDAISLSAYPYSTAKTFPTQLTVRSGSTYPVTAQIVQLGEGQTLEGFLRVSGSGTGGYPVQHYQYEILPGQGWVVPPLNPGRYVMIMSVRTPRYDSQHSRDWGFLKLLGTRTIPGTGGCGEPSRVQDVYHRYSFANAFSTVFTVAADDNGAILASQTSDPTRRTINNGEVRSDDEFGDGIGAVEGEDLTFELVSADDESPTGIGKREWSSSPGSLGSLGLMIPPADLFFGNAPGRQGQPSPAPGSLQVQAPTWMVNGQHVGSGKKITVAASRFRSGKNSVAAVTGSGKRTHTSPFFIAPVYSLTFQLGRSFSFLDNAAKPINTFLKSSGFKVKAELSGSGSVKVERTSKPKQGTTVWKLSFANAELTPKFAVDGPIGTFGRRFESGPLKFDVGFFAKGEVGVRLAVSGSIDQPLEPDRRKLNGSVSGSAYGKAGLWAGIKAGDTTSSKYSPSNSGVKEISVAGSADVGVAAAAYWKNGQQDIMWKNSITTPALAVEAKVKFQNDLEFAFFKFAVKPIPDIESKEAPTGIVPAVLRLISPKSRAEVNTPRAPAFRKK